METVFLVFYHDYDETRLLDIFKTKELAKEYVERYFDSNDDDRAEIAEYEVRDQVR